jgi:steroid 5-alpha reductase family enzyme
MEPTLSAVVAAAAGAVYLAMGGLFLLSLRLGDNSIADVAYGPMCAIGVWAAALAHGSGHPRQLLLIAMVTAWGLRLAVHIWVRNRGRGEDPRYRAWRERWGRWFVPRSFLQIYVLQGTIVLVISAPVLLAVRQPGGPLGFLDAAGVLVWAVGLVFEAVGDAQLLHFVRDPSRRGLVLDTGLWRYTRHPNYFGEALLWWGPFLVALSTPDGVWALVSPLTIGALLLFVSGIPMLEARMARSPAFRAYQARTSAFVPWFPRRGSTP